MSQYSEQPITTFQERFRGYLPVVIDVETGGFNPASDALLEIAATTLRLDKHGILHPDQTYTVQILPFEGANIEPKSLEITGIDPYSSLRGAKHEKEAITELFSLIRSEIKVKDCQRAILVGHNAAFDLSFINAAIARNKIKRNPFHSFSCFDTVTLSALAFGQTVLARACSIANIEFNAASAHSAAYDAKKTAELFCFIYNRWHDMAGWDLIDTHNG